MVKKYEHFLINPCNQYKCFDFRDFILRSSFHIWPKEDPIKTFRQECIREGFGRTAALGANEKLSGKR